MSDSTVSRPRLAGAGEATCRMPDRHRRSRRGLDALLADTPEFAVVLDTFEQRIPRPRNRPKADRVSSGKQQHPLTAQVAVDEARG